MAKSMIRKPVGRQQTFSLEAPEASAVQLVGDFTSWAEQPINMEKDLEGIWRVTVALGPGRHSYRFIADGVWCDDPECPARESNPYGSQNAVRQVA
ncbi:MAG: isoamylase early set domain-containing protein [Verrucomicrobia bacterium]|nr:isoamylase early set domain-containing protein [Verrucomicrobiota bacterium]